MSASRRAHVTPHSRLALANHNPETVKRRHRQARRRAAQDAVAAALKAGRIARASRCQSCGSTSELEAHHVDKHYYRKMDVRWLCKRCHHRVTINRET